MSIEVTATRIAGYANITLNSSLEIQTFLFHIT